MKQKQMLISLFLVLTSVVSLLVGCSTPQSTDSTDATRETEAKETVAENIENKSVFYRGTQRTLTTTLDGIDKYSIQDEKILGVGDVVDVESKVISYYLTSWEENWNEEWKEKKQIELPFTSMNYKIHCNGLDMDSEGNTYALFNDRSQNHIYLLKVDESGEIVQNIDLIHMLPTDVDYTGIELIVVNANKIYLKNSQESVVYGLDGQGNLIGEYKVEEGYLWDMPKNNENQVYLVTEKKNQLYLSAPIDGEEMLFDEGKGILVNRYMSVYEGIDNTFFVTTPNGLICYDVENQTTTQLIDWLSAGVDYLAIDYVGVMQKEEEQIITVLAEPELGSKDIDIYTFINVDESESEKLILATLKIKSELGKQVIAYNKLHPEFPIEIRYYEDSEEGLRKLNTDLLVGNIIDIIDANSLNHLTSLDYYAEQGLLEDIGAWIKEDETIDETDLLQSILEANKIDGVLYNLVPSFGIETFAGAKKIVGDDFVWTVEEAMDVMESHPESNMYAYQTKEQFISDLCRYNGAYLVNEEEGICHFDSDEFVRLLTYANTLPDKIANKISTFDYIYNQKNLLFQTKKFNIELISYRAAKELFRQGVTQDDFSLVGFPTLNEKDANGSIFVNAISIAMASTSAKKETAWQFFQYLLSDAYQWEEYVLPEGFGAALKHEFPIRMSSIQKVLQAQLTDEGNAGSGFFHFYLDPVTNTEIIIWEITYGYATQEDLDTVTAFIQSINRVAWENDTIYNIVWEEAQYYFAGECTAEQAAQRMQNRVGLYLMEKE